MDQVTTQHIKNDAREIVISYNSHQQDYKTFDQKKKKAEAAKNKKAKELTELLDKVLKEKGINFPGDRKKELFSRTLRLLSGEETVIYMKPKSIQDKFFTHFTSKLENFFGSIDIEINVDRPNSRVVLKKI